MQLKHIKESIKNRQACNGSIKNSYRIGVTMKDRNKVANRKFKLELRDSLKDIAIDKSLLKTIRKQALKQGIRKDVINTIGTTKLLQMLA